MDQGAICWMTVSEMTDRTDMVLFHATAMAARHCQWTGSMGERRRLQKRARGPKLWPGLFKD